MSTEPSQRTASFGYVGDMVRKQFTGYERDEEIGLDFAQARTYSNKLGRFISADEPLVGQDENDAQSWNLYLYARNNPLRLIDPTGKDSYEPGFWTKLLNFIAWGVWGGEEDVQREEQARREELQELAAQGGQADGSLIVQNPYGSWVRIYPSNMNRPNVFLWSGYIRGLMADGGKWQDLTPDILASVTPVRGSGSVDARRRKPVNLPPAKNVSVKMEHVRSGHMEGGQRAAQSTSAGGAKDIFPANMSEGQIKNAILDAYNYSKPIRTQGDRVLLRGTTREGMVIEMWLNKVTKIIETAYPK